MPPPPGLDGVYQGLEVVVLGMRLRMFAVFGLVAGAVGCAQAPQSGGTPFYVLCDQARAEARRGDAAGSAATLNRITDLRDVITCQLLLDRDAGREPSSGA